MAEHHLAVIPAAPGYFARMDTPDRERTRLRVVAWTWDGDYGWPVVEQPTMNDHCPAIIAAMRLHEEHGWRYLGTIYMPPVDAVLPAGEPEGEWVARFDAEDGHGPLELDVVAWAFRRGEATAIVVDPGSTDGEYDHALVEAEYLETVLGWHLLGVGPA